jgi:hypothetical protein
MDHLPGAGCVRPAPSSCGANPGGRQGDSPNPARFNPASLPPAFTGIPTHAGPFGDQTSNGRPYADRPHGDRNTPRLLGGWGPV